MLSQGWHDGAAPGFFIFFLFFWLDPKELNSAQAERKAELARALLRRSRISEAKRSRPQKTGLPHGLSKRVSFTAGSAFFESKRSAKAPRPAMNLNPLSSALWRAPLRFWAEALAPYPVKWRPAYNQLLRMTKLEWAGRVGKADRRGRACPRED